MKQGPLETRIGQGKVRGQSSGMGLQSVTVSQLYSHRWLSSISVRGQASCSSDAPEESGSWPRTVQWNQIEVNADDQQSAKCEGHQGIMCGTTGLYSKD